jgi:Cu/Ag efflux pump CusA
MFDCLNKSCCGKYLRCTGHQSDVPSAVIGGVLSSTVLTLLLLPLMYYLVHRQPADAKAI